MEWCKGVGQNALYGLLIRLLHSIWAQADWTVFAQTNLLYNIPTVFAVGICNIEILDHLWECHLLTLYFGTFKSNTMNHINSLKDL